MGVAFRGRGFVTTLTGIVGTVVRVGLGVGRVALTVATSTLVEAGATDIPGVIPGANS
jgi:hypothetical protein